MNVEVISIGEELLSGMIVNTNAAFISKELKVRGWNTLRQTTLTDNFDLLKTGLSEALKRSSVVIATGGLGPTGDDLTRSVAASLFHSDFYFDDTIAQDLKRRYGDGLTSLNDQARVPTKAKPLLNHVGTAPGLIFESSSSTLILLPGPPREMQPLFLEQVIPYLEKHHPPSHRQARLVHHLCLLSENEVDPFLRTLTGVEYGIYPGYGTLTVTLSCPDEKSLQRASMLVQEQFAGYFFEASSGKVAEALLHLFRKRGKTLACAESCTGGKIASEITAISGSSDYFLGSLVTYSNELKKALLSVSEESLQRHGAVSKEVVSEMLAGLFKATSADYGMAVSGIAGPTGGTEEKPVGTIWAAIGERGKPPHIWTFRSKGGSRENIILYTATCLLATLYRRMHK